MKSFIFNTNSVNAIISGQKYQTRRVIKKDIRRGSKDLWLINIPGGVRTGITKSMHTKEVVMEYSNIKAGDKVYGRETWATNSYYDNIRPSELSEDTDIYYKAGYEDKTIKWRSPMFMPEWASRLILRITSIKVEHLHDISLEDIKAEGCPMERIPDWYDKDEAIREWWQNNWDFIHWGTPYRYDNNPVVFVYEFKLLGYEGKKD